MNKISPVRNIQRKKINHYTAPGIVIYLPLKRKQLSWGKLVEERTRFTREWIGGFDV